MASILLRNSSECSIKYAHLICYFGSYTSTMWLGLSFVPKRYEFIRVHNTITIKYREKYIVVPICAIDALHSKTHAHTNQKGVTLTLQYMKCVQTPYHLVYIRTKLNYIVCRYFIHCTQPLKMKSSIRTRSLWCESTFFFWQTFEAIWNFPYIWYVTCYINMQAMYYLSNVECWMSHCLNILCISLRLK